MTNAIVSLLYNTNYLPGALVLGISIRKLLSLERQHGDLNIQLVLLIDKGQFSQYQLSLLLKFYDELIDVAILASNLSNKLSNDLGRPELDKTFTKIQLWSLYDKFEKILYLDADTLPNIPTTNEQSSILNLLKLDFPKNYILAAPDSGFPDIFNSGVFLLKPNASDYNNLVHIVQSSRDEISFDGADQGLLNQYFNSQPDWIVDLLQDDESSVLRSFEVQSSSWIKIPFMYNTTPSAQYEYLPAYKHFAQPVETTPSQNLKTTPFDINQSESDVTNNQLKSINQTLERYNYSALNFYDGENTQIKLIHFIGPIKPWNGNSQYGIFTKWWNIWNSTFDYKSVSEVVHSDHESIFPSVIEPSLNKNLIDHTSNVEGSIANELVKENQSEGAQSEKIDEFVHEHFQDYALPEIKGPEDLCDPNNYQHIPDLIQPNPDASWNSAIEPPPHSSGHQKVESFGNGRLESDFRSFTNAWDSNLNEDNKIDKDSVAVSKPETNSLTESKVDSFQDSEFGFYKNQKAERVFNDDSNYIPSHLLSLEKKDQRKPQDPERSSMNVDDQNEVTSIDAIQFNKVNEKLEKLGLIDDKHEVEEIFSDIDGEDENDGDHEYTPKLFPWEFKQSIAPERVFD